MDKNRVITKLNIFAVAVVIFIASFLCVKVSHFNAFAKNDDYTPLITAEEKTVHRGQTFTISVDLSDNEGLISLYLSLSYDNTAMHLTGVEKGSALDSLTFTTTNSQTNVGYDIIPFNLFWDGTLPDISNGDLITLTFESFSDAPIGNYPITLSFDRANTNSNYGQPIDVTIKNGSVSLVKGEFETIYYDWDGKELYRKDYNADDVPSFVGDTPSRPADERYSYSFVGWKGIVSDEPNVIKYMADYAFTPKIYQVFYYVDGINNEHFDGIISLDDFYRAEEVAFGTYLENDYPIKARHIFSGWFLDDKFSEPFTQTSMPANDLTLYGYFVYDIRTTQIPKIKLSYSEIDNNSITVNAEMVKNTGFNGMVLTLNYDKTAMSFVGFEKGATFKDLQFDTTNTEEGFDADNFKFYYEHSENTFETGVFLKLIFNIKNNASTGVYNVSFTLSNTDATYISDNNNIRYTDIEIIGTNIPIGKIFEWEKNAEDNAGIYVRSDQGMPSDTILKVALVPQSMHNVESSDIKDVLGKDMELMTVYRLQLIRVLDGEEVEVEPDGKITVEIKLTAVQQACRSLELCYINDAGEIIRFESEREGDVLRFKTDHLSLWAIAGEVAAVSGIMSDAAVMLITLPILLAIATMSYVLIIIGKNKKLKEKID